MMPSNETMRRRWWIKLSGGALVLLSLTGIGLPRGRAQLDFQGGFVHIHRDDDGDAFVLPLAPSSPRPSLSLRLSYSPDHDFHYRPNSLASTPITRSYYPATTSITNSNYAGGKAENPVSLSAGGLPHVISAAALPWNRPDFKDYDEPPPMPDNTSLPAPRKYSLEATPLAEGSMAARLEGALLIAHVPEHAQLWIDGRLTRSTGRTRYFQSPPLTPGEKYSYIVRVAWLEDGRWVSQTRKIPVRAGLIQAIFLRSRYVGQVRNGLVRQHLLPVAYRQQQQAQLALGPQSVFAN